MYKLFIGDYLKEGTPATWTLVYQSHCKKIIKRVIEELKTRVKPGMELYIVHKDRTNAYFREGGWNENLPMVR